MTDLTQAEADALLAMHKRPLDNRPYQLPDLGGRLLVPLESLDAREAFTLDISRGRINLAKGTYQHRARQTVILARLDFGGAPHRNPDEAEIGVPYLHLYREGFADKWAFPVPPDRFRTLGDRWDLLTDFMRFCAVVEPPEFDRSLFA